MTTEMEKEHKENAGIDDDDIDVGNEEPSVNKSTREGEKEARLHGDDVVNECNKTEDGGKETEQYSKSGSERNGFVPILNRKSDNYLKRKYSEIEESDEHPHKLMNDNLRIRTDEQSPTSFNSEQIFPMDASLKTLSAVHSTGLAINSIINSKSSSTIGSLFEERLKSSTSVSEHSRVYSSSLSQKAQATSSSDSKEEPKPQIHRPSFMITDILSSDSNRKDREVCQNMFTDPRVLSLPHRHFIDRPMTASSCGSDPGSGAVHRFTDDSDCDDDNSDNEGNTII